jgi:hypothetical protein
MNNHFIPFTANVRIFPVFGKRFERIRDMQKIAIRVQESLLLDEDLNLASPGGGQHRSFSSIEGFGGHADGVSAKPGFGDTPAQLTIVGFLKSTAAQQQPQPTKPIFHTGQYLQGFAGRHGWNVNPNPIVDEHASLIKSKIEDAMVDAIGPNFWSVYRLEVSGTRYGEKGYHFPRPVST